MNEDELRAFLESATVGGDDDGDRDGTPENEAPEAPARAAAFDEAAPTAPMPAVQAPEDPAAPAAEPQPGRLPSFDELMGIKRDPAPAAPSAPAAPAAPGPVIPPVSAASAAAAAASTPGAEPELTPLVLPGPGTRPATPAAPAVPSNPQAPTAFSPQPARSTQRPAAVPVAAPPAAATPTPARTSPLPTGIGALAGQGAAQNGIAPNGASASGSSGGDDYEKISVTGGEKKRFIPWIVVGAGAVVALIAAVLIVFAVRGGGEPAPTAAPTTSESPEPDPSESTAPEPSDEPDETPAPDEAPTVEVGQTGDFPIPDWGLSGQISGQLGWPQYRFEGENLILFGGSLLPQFPDSCAAMREGFGLTRQADGSLEVLRPAERCAAAPELYDQVWGLVAATIPTFQKTS